MNSSTLNKAMIVNRALMVKQDRPKQETRVQRVNWTEQDIRVGQGTRVEQCIKLEEETRAEQGTRTL